MLHFLFLLRQSKKLNVTKVTLAPIKSDQKKSADINQRFLLSIFIQIINRRFPFHLLFLLLRKNERKTNQFQTRYT